MEFKLKLCFQNDLIRFIVDKLDKISKLILVCMRSVTPIFYFILLKCLMKNICCLIFHLKLPFPLLKNRQFVFPPITYCFRVKILKSIWSSNFQSSFRIIYWFIFWLHSKTNLNQSADRCEIGSWMQNLANNSSWFLYEMVLRMLYIFLRSRKYTFGTY